MKGLVIAENPMGFKTVRLHFTADPAKDPSDPLQGDTAQRWLDTMRLSFPDPNDWQREMEINFFVGVGTRVYPQFTEVTHTRPVEANRRKTLYRGWDFGWHAPACVIGQVDTKERLLVCKEVIGSKQTTKDFAQSVIQKCAEWFPQHTAGYEDFCDPAGQQQKAIESEQSERRDVEVLNGLGIFPRYEYGWSRKDGRALIHQLLQVRVDQTPSLYVDLAGCSILAQGFLGRYVFPETRDGKTREEPDDETHPYADIMAALRYLVTGLHWKLGLRRMSRVEPVHAEEPVSYQGYGTPTKR